MQDVAAEHSSDITSGSSKAQRAPTRDTAVRCGSDAAVESSQGQSPGTQSTVPSNSEIKMLLQTPSWEMQDLAASGSSDTAGESSKTLCRGIQDTTSPISSSVAGGWSQTQTGGPTFFCPNCALVFDFPHKLSEHLREHDHPNERPYSCDKCDITINIVRVIERSYTSTRKEYPCNKCDVSFSQSEDLKKHMESHAADTEWLPCEKCKASFLSSSDLKQHRLQHAGPGPFYCRGCPASFSEVAALKVHMRDVEHPHGISQLFPCDKCATMFKTIRDCKTHKSNPFVHSKTLKTFSCNHCLATFSSRNALREHKKVHSELPMRRCEKCQDTIFRNSYLAKFLLKNPGVRLFECRDCDALRHSPPNPLPQSSSLSQPKSASLQDNAVSPLDSVPQRTAVFSASSKFPALGKSATGHTAVPSLRPSVSECGTVAASEEVRLVFCTADNCTAQRYSSLTEYIHTHLQTENVPAYFCTKCDAIFAQYGDLIAHMSVEHSAEEPFTCKKCAAAFSSHNELKEHMKNHGARYFCEKCGDAFATCVCLTLHFTREHPGEKHFPCDTCGAIFLQQNSLKSHQQSHASMDTYRNKEAFSCWDCSAVFTKKCALISHRKHRHVPLPPNLQSASCGYESQSGVQGVDTCVKHKSKSGVSHSADISDKLESESGMSQNADVSDHLKSESGVSYGADVSDMLKSESGASQDADISANLGFECGVSHGADVNDVFTPESRVSHSTDAGDELKSKSVVSQNSNTSCRRRSKFGVLQGSNANGKGKSKSAVTKNAKGNTSQKRKSMSGVTKSAKGDTSQKRKSVSGVTKCARGNTSHKHKSVSGVTKSAKGNTSQKHKPVSRVAKGARGNTSQKHKSMSGVTKSAKVNTSHKHKSMSGVAKGAKVNTSQKHKSKSGTQGAVHKHVCYECHASFKQARSLRVHQRLHAMKIIYSCHLCSATFKLAKKWEAHLDRHAEGTSPAPKKSEVQQRRREKERDSGGSKRWHFVNKDTYRVVLKPM